MDRVVDERFVESQEGMRHEDDIWTDIQFQQILTKPKTRFSSIDITTGFYGKEGVEFQREAIPIMAELESMGFTTAKDLILEVMSAHACTTKGTGNQATLITRLSAYRFRYEDAEKEGLLDRLGRILNKYR
jgi:hypothetical protein